MFVFAPTGSPQVSKLRKMYRSWKASRRRVSERSLWLPSPSACYEIKSGYRHRLDNSYFDDFAFNTSTFLQEAQREVYELAAQAAIQLDAKLVFDIGCGAGIKTTRYFTNEYHTVGFDVPQTVDKLKNEYPNHDWRSVAFSESVEEQPDVVICADVIEHIPDPDELVMFLTRLGAKRYFISTPDRLSMYGRDDYGPPENSAHCREWTMTEFEIFLGKSFRIIDHVISNEHDHTQLAICELK